MVFNIKIVQSLTTPDLLGVVAHAFHTSLGRQRLVGLYEFEARLLCRESQDITGLHRETLS